MTSLAIPGGVTDTFVYNGLGLRVGKTDSTGTYTYLCDGASPGSPVLYDGHTLYTPGLSENTGGTSRYYSNDLLGNLWTQDGSSKGQLTYEDFSGFGGPVAGSSAGSPFGYGGGNGCQSDADTGLVLMGHRYYDARIGRFISQDPAGDGDNWYAYADNSPTNEVDPEGLAPMDGPGSSPVGTPGYMDSAASGSAGAYTEYAETSLGHWTNGPGTLVLNDKNGQYIANQYEGHTYWVADGFDPNFYSFGLDLDSKITRAVGRAFIFNLKLLKEDFQYGVALSMNPVPSRGIGPSGKPKIHNPKFPTKKAAFEAAKRASKGGLNPDHHPNPLVGDPHYHPVDAAGNIIKNGVHYNYPP